MPSTLLEQVHRPGGQASVCWLIYGAFKLVLVLIVGFWWLIDEAPLLFWIGAGVYGLIVVRAAYDLVREKKLQARLGAEFGPLQVRQHGRAAKGEPVTLSVTQKTYKAVTVDCLEVSIVLMEEINGTSRDGRGGVPYFHNNAIWKHTEQALSNTVTSLGEQIAAEVGFVMPDAARLEREANERFEKRIHLDGPSQRILEWLVQVDFRFGDGLVHGAYFRMCLPGHGVSGSITCTSQMRSSDQGPFVTLGLSHSEG